MARRACPETARRIFGSGRQRCRPPSRQRSMSISTLRQDLRYTLRTLRRDAGFASFAILIAGLGIGASATVFSVLNALLLRPLPFATPERLVWVTNQDSSGLSGQTTQVGYMLDLRERTQTLSELAGYFAFYGVGDNVLSGRGEPERLNGVPVSDNFFRGPRRPAAAWTHVHRRRVSVARTQGGVAQSQPVGASLCVGSGSRREPR